jgi:hypothetical protein
VLPSANGGRPAAATLISMRYLSLALLIALSAVACGGLPTAAPSTSVATTVPSGPPTTAEPSVAPCLDDPGSFFSDGPLGSESRNTADAAKITGMALTPYETCEQLIVELAAASGAPATSLGMTTAEFVRRHGVVRVHLDPSVTGTTVSDIVFESALVDRVYVVRDADESLFIDVHLADAAVARFTEISSPARLVVDLAPGGPDIIRAEQTDFIVIMPLDDTLVGPITIEGYGRTFEANVIARARRDGVLIAETFTTSADYLETWGWFELDLEPGATGAIELFVGEDSARDGQEQGVYLAITIEN